VGFNGDKNVYMDFLKERDLHLKKHAITRLYSRAYFVGFVYNCISLSGPLCLLGEPCFYHKKIISMLVFPPFIFYGYLPKNIGVYVLNALFSSISSFIFI
jgi:hypothetical protein